MILSVLPEGAGDSPAPPGAPEWESAAAPTIDAAALFCKNRDGRIQDFLLIDGQPILFQNKVGKPTSAPRPSIMRVTGLDHIARQMHLPCAFVCIPAERFYVIGKSEMFYFPIT